jgi:Raf kinase inhibitor-like YbhB/YbcL family protein
LERSFSISGIALGLVLAACGGNGGTDADSGPGGSFAIRSSAFANGAAIPVRHAYLGCGVGAANVSPALELSGIPAGTLGIAIVVDDPDAGDFVHWTVWDIPPSTASIPEGVPPSAPGFVQGTNDFGETGYGGPCPPAEHTYRFRAYALDVATLGESAGAAPFAVRAALAMHTIATADWTGRYAP